MSVSKITELLEVSQIDDYKPHYKEQECSFVMGDFSGKVKYKQNKIPYFGSKRKKHSKYKRQKLPYSKRLISILKSIARIMQLAKKVK